MKITENSESNRIQINQYENLQIGNPNIDLNKLRYS